ncbi:hypothetical protein AVEN_435-1, partial [Araneus ventricosus]
MDGQDLLMFRLCMYGMERGDEAIGDCFQPFLFEVRCWLLHMPRHCEGALSGIVKCRSTTTTAALITVRDMEPFEDTCDLVANSQLPGGQFLTSKPVCTEDPSCMWAWWTLNRKLEVKHPPAGVVQKFGKIVPAYVRHRARFRDVMVAGLISESTNNPPYIRSWCM